MLPRISQPVAKTGAKNFHALERSEGGSRQNPLTKTLGLVSGAVLGAVALGGSLAMAPRAAEALTFSNGGGTFSYVNPAPNAGQWYATSFTINTGYYLDQLVIQSAASDGGQGNTLSASIYSNNAGTPGTLAANLAGTFPDPTPAPVMLTPSTQLGAGTYWVVVQGNGGNFGSLGVLNAPTNSGSGGSIGTVLASSIDSGATWDTVTTANDAIQMAFTVSVPFEFSPAGGVLVLGAGYGIQQLIKRRRAAAKIAEQSVEETSV